MELRHVRGLTGVDVTAYDIAGCAPGQHLGLPSATATLVIDLTDGLVLASEDRPVPQTFRCCLAGMHLRPVTIHHNGIQRGVQVALSPSAVRKLFGLPAAKLAGEMFELAQIDARFARRLFERLAETPPAQRDAVCTSVIAEAVSDTRPTFGTEPEYDAQAAWAAIARSRGTLNIGELTALSGWSARYLTKSFTAEYGLGPKQAARLMRFDAARSALESGHRPSQVAADCGFADQSHMSREFSTLTGLTPRALMNRRIDEFGRDEFAQ